MNTENYNPDDYNSRKAFVEAVARNEYGQLDLKHLIELALQHITEPEWVEWITNIAIAHERGQREERGCRPVEVTSPLTSIDLPHVNNDVETGIEKLA